MSDAAKPAASRAGTAAPAGGDPSMDDILASIRRILSEDDAAPREPAAVEPRMDAEADEDEAVFDLDASMLVETHVAPVAVEPVPAEPLPSLYAPRRIEPPALDGGLADVAQVPSPVAATPPVTPMPSSDPNSGHPASGHDDDALVTPEAAAATASAMGALRRSLEGGRAAPSPVAVLQIARSGGPTLEDMVREELRPVLKAWLDSNLPPIVERLVRAEIERVVGRAAS